MQTIARKFLVKQIPDLTGKEHWAQSRFYLYRKNGIVIRTQSNGDNFDLERKVSKTALIRESEKIAITKDEFEEISKVIAANIIRDSYIISEIPYIVLRMYHGKFEGLIRVEVEFLSVEEANRYIPLKWMGKEITNTLLAKDETLLTLTGQDFRALL
ncbi:MAG: hypothetical protein AAB492_05805 [Patescibacteria group bacterium]